MKNLRSLFLFIAAIMAALPAFAADGVRGNLVDAAWLQKNLNDSNLVILDASPETYAKGHVPGAISANIYDLFAYGFGNAPESTANNMFQSWGLSLGKKVVVYDGGGDNRATRLFFDLDYHGFPEKDILYLDGGLAKWKQLGLPLSTATPAPKPGAFKIGKKNEDLRVGLSEVVTGSGDPDHTALVEALGPDWHFGELHPFDRAGHIPNGILASSDYFYNADKTFKSPEEIKRIFTYLGVRPDQQIYTYCGGGVAATVPFFAARFIANYPHVKVFPESEIGWLSDQRGLPYWTYDEPYLLRSTEWLQLWTGRMIRQFLGSTISIVDVRPPAEYAAGHVPFSLNIPGETFKADAGSPEKLATLLGPAGVDPSQEAVIVSGSGITKDAALAYVLLEKTGQKKVSLMIDPLDKWARPGNALSKEATVIGPKKSPRDVVIPPVAYPVNLREGVAITDAKSTHGLYPRVYLASGKDMPSKTFDAKVVHVAYTDLLNADGTLKPASEIWKLLDKAGVPRLAELVCVSDDPGEAAVNYFILKLMGYPDIKVLVG